LYCHSDYVNHMLPTEPNGEMVYCVHCHGDVGHSGRESGVGKRD
jgi:cytochrome c nitrite reductase small subunit